MTGKSGSLLRAAAQSSALPCGPASMRRTRAPVLARLEPMLIASVVLPTPPFWFSRPMIAPLRPHRKAQIRGYSIA